MVPTIPKPNHSKYRHFNRISNVFLKKWRPFVWISNTVGARNTNSEYQMPFENRTFLTFESYAVVARIPTIWSLLPRSYIILYIKQSRLLVSNVQDGDLGCSRCLLELPVCLAQGVIWERAVKVSCSQSN